MPFTHPVGTGDYGEPEYGNGSHIQFYDITGNFDKYFTIG